MKVLLLNQFFWPDASATSQLLTDLARGMVEAGHEVTAICSDKGGYAVASGEVQPPAVRIVRVRSLPFRRGKLGRIVSYLSFYMGALWHALTLPRQDLVLTLTTPPLLPLLGTVLRAVRGSRYVIWEMDMYPDVAVDLGYFARGGILDRLVGVLADLARRNANTILALGPCMQQRLEQRGIAPERIAIAHNWADGAAIQPLPPEETGRLTLLYSGNLGLAHDVETVVAAADLLRDDPRFHFIFVGSGGRRAELQALAQQHTLDSIDLRPYVERQSLGQSLALGDIGLVTQRASCVGSVVPSKVYGLLAAGRPILYIGPRTTTPAQVIEQFGCGWVVANGDAAALAALLRHLAEAPEEVLAAGRRARQAFEAHFDLPLGVRRILDVLHLTSRTNARSSPPGPTPQEPIPVQADAVGLHR